MERHTVRRSGRLAWLIVALACGGSARADVYGGIEIGAKGVKATAIAVTGDGESMGVETLMAGSENTTLTAGLSESGLFAPPAVKNTAAAVAKFAAAMQKDFKVAPEHVFVVGSSGLFSGIEGRPEAIKANQDTLAKAVRDACGLAMTFIDVKREAELSIAGAIPAKHVGSSVLLDVGSGNTKGGLRDGQNGMVTFGVPFGSVTFTEGAKKRPDGGSYAEKAAAHGEQAYLPALKRSVADKPALLDRHRVYLSGGAAWAMATFLHPGSRNAYEPITAADVAAYRQMLTVTPGQYPNPGPGAGAGGQTERGRKDVERVKSTFTPEQLLSGSVILQGLSDEFGFKDREVFFARNANLAWILAYVKEQSTTR